MLIAQAHSNLLALLWDSPHRKALSPVDKPAPCALLRLWNQENKLGPGQALLDKLSSSHSHKGRTPLFRCRVRGLSWLLPTLGLQP